MIPRNHHHLGIVVAVWSFSLFLAPFSCLSAASFINPASIKIAEVIPAPPVPGSEEFKTDTGYLKNARATATQEQIAKALKAVNDSVFDYSEVLGAWFSASNLPKTKTLFEEVTTETDKALSLAKNHFARPRPLSWQASEDHEQSDGFSYPSGHTTRAFVWAILLSKAFPKDTTALHHEARQKGWYRVLLGRHFPADVRGGKIFGEFLAEQFLKSPEFQKKWAPAVAEMQAAREKSVSHG